MHDTSDMAKYKVCMNMCMYGRIEFGVESDQIGEHEDVILHNMRKE